jgi:hypothetical protein
MTTLSLGDTVKLKSLKLTVTIPQPNGTVIAINNDKITVLLPTPTKPIKLLCGANDLELVAKAPEIMVVCYHCGKLLPKSKAFYLQHFNAYYCETHWVALQEGEPIKLPNYRRGSA